jgi:hypothetical protein
VSYAQIDDGILERLLVLGVDEDAANLYLRAIVWCNRNLTDGWIPKTAITSISQSKLALRRAGHLVEKGRWIDHGDRWEVHDYLDWNDSRETVLARRARAREHMANVRANNRRT